MEIKTIEQFLVEKGIFITTDTNKHFNLNTTRDCNVKISKDIVKAVKEYAEYILDYASENVEVDYNKLTPVFYKGNIVDDGVEVFIPKGEFDKIKELIK